MRRESRRNRKEDAMYSWLYTIVQCSTTAGRTGRRDGKREMLCCTVLYMYSTVLYVL